MRAELAAERIGERAEQVDLPGNSAELKATTADGTASLDSLNAALDMTFGTPTVRRARSVPAPVSVAAIRMVSAPNVALSVSVMRSVRSVTLIVVNVPSVQNAQSVPSVQNAQSVPAC